MQKKWFNKLCKIFVVCWIMGSAGIAHLNALESNAKSQAKQSTQSSAKSQTQTNAQIIVKNGELGSFIGDSKIFSGQVKVTMLFKDAPYRAFGGALVEFSKGARTVWHTHPAGQTLIITDGVIYTSSENGEVQIARKGDVVLCPPNVKHWHGAGAKQAGSHIALTGIKDGQNVVWLEHLSEGEYREAIKNAK